MIKQNESIALGIVRRMKKMSSLELFMSFSVEEWEEYLLFFLYQSHDPRDSRVNFEMEVKHWFPIEFGNDRDGGSTDSRTFSDLEDEIMPPQKMALSKAVNNLLTKNAKDMAFLESMLLFLSLHAAVDGAADQLIAYDFSVLQGLIDSEDTSKEIRESIFYALSDVIGIQKPAPPAFLKIMLRYRELYKRSDSILCPILYWLIKEGWHHEAFNTLKYLEQWPKGHPFDGEIAKMLKPYIYGMRDNQSVTVKYVAEEILPFLSEEVKKNLILVLKKGYAKGGDFESISDDKFPADTTERKLIDAL